MPKKQLLTILTLLVLVLALFTLAGCKRSSSEVDATPALSPVPAAQKSTPAASAVPSALTRPVDSDAPAKLAVITTQPSALDPACLEDSGKFALQSAAMPETGLEPGMEQFFCVTGVPAGETVTLTLASPDGREQQYQVTSAEHNGVVAAVQPIGIGADAQPGKWQLTATWQDAKASQSFKVQPASQPFLALLEPVDENPSVIRVAVGGLQAGAKARFAIYRLQPGAEGTARGDLLLANLIQVDEAGRADLALDVADQPGGPYLLLLLPAAGEAPDPTSISLTEQARMALAIDIVRTDQPQASQPGGPSSPANLPPAPQLTEAGGGLPEATGTSLTAATLPPCTPSDAPTVQLWPQSGEAGQWWYGCASGFAPEKALNVQATLGDGSKISFDLTPTATDGTKSFRWYSMPDEGTGTFTITLSDYQEHQASATWEIAPASQPHLLVYPHVVLQDVGAKLILTGFPSRAQVQLGLYRMSADGAATLAQKQTVKTGKRGMVQNDFVEADALEPGIYMLVAQSAPTYQFAGIDTPASAIEFFSVGAPLDEKFEFYTLFAGRDAGQQIAQPAPQTPQSGENESTAPAETTSSGLPATLDIPVDTSAPPTCPDAAADATAICIMPTTLDRATYLYMLMQGFEPGERFAISVKGPRGGVDKFSVQADANGFADAHWYALNDDRLGTYKVRISGGDKTLTESFKVVKAAAPHVLVQPREPQPGTPVIISFSGLQPKTTYAMARYRSTGESDGQLHFQFMDVLDMTTGKGGGAKASFATSKADANTLFMAVLFDKTTGELLAQEVYAPGTALYLRYPFAWNMAQ
jgi:5-hydroxyisourate hydrolase-like protein (transthyretin family)